MSLLRVENLTVDFKTYQGIARAVRHNSFILPEGQVLGIVGESGCGKSVTANSLLGLLPREKSIVTADVLSLEGNDLREYNETQWEKIRGTKIGMIFQDPMTALNPILTIGTQLNEAIARSGLERKDWHTRAIQLLTDVGISAPEERLHQYPHEFSGGMRQRIVIAMAIAGEPRLLIADEPTTALDVTTEAQILLLLKRILRDQQMGMIFISHNLRVIAQMCDRVMVMYGGTKVEEGSVEAIFEHPSHPYTQGLLQSIPQGKERGQLKAIGGQAPDLFNLPKGCPFHPRCEHAMRICAIEEPKRLPVDDTHEVACWLHYKEVRTVASSLGNGGVNKNLY